MRALKASEVTFTVATEPEDTPVRGNLCATDDPDIDRAAEDAVLARLERGDSDAWCGVIVTAHWGGYQGTDSLWCCSLDDTYTAAMVAEAHGMHKEALADLNAKLAALDASLAPLRD